MGRKIAKKNRLPINQRNARIRAAIEQMESRVMLSAFTPGDLVVYRVGTGTGALGSGSTAVFLDEYSPTGTLVQSIPLPTALSGSNNPLTASGTATSEGNLSVSQDGSHLLLTGYDAITGVAGIATSNSSTTGSITKVTAATPSVISTASTAGMTSGDPVTISGSFGIAFSPVQSTYFLKVVSTTTFSLFTTSALTTGVAGTGTYTSGGTWTDTNLVPTLRDVGIVSANGTFDTTTTLGSAFDNNNIRGAASVDGLTGIWAAGSNGIVYTTAGSTSSGASLSTSNLRTIQVTGNQVYADSSSVLGALGSGLPTSGAQTLTQLSGITDSSTSGAGLGGPYEFAFATLNGGSTPDTVYIADNFNDGVDKYSLVSGNWVINGEIGAFGSGGNVLSGVTGVVAEPVAAGEEIYITLPGKIYSIVDPFGYNSAGASQGGTAAGGVFSSTPPLTTVASAATNEAFRGLAFVPVAAPLVTSVTPGIGSTAGGNTVIINGWDFTGATTVNFGGTPASSFTVLSTNQISAVVPAESSSTVDVTVTGPLGMSATSAADNYTFTTAPVVSSLSSNAAPLVGGTTVTITGANFTPTSTVSFGSTAATSVTFVSPSQIIAVAPAESAATVDVIVTDGAKSSATSAADKFTFAGAATVTGVSPSTGDDSGGSAVTVTGTNFFSGATVTFGGLPATVKSVNSTQIVVVTPFNGTAGGTASTGTVDIVVTSIGGASAIVPADQYAYGVTTNATAETNFGQTSGTSVTLDNNSVVSAILSQPGTADTSAHDWSILVNDGTGSIDLFAATLPDGYTPTVGDVLSVSGTWSPFDSIPEIAPTAITVITPGNGTSTFGPVTKTVSQLAGSTLPLAIAGQLVTVNNVTISGISGTFAGSNLSGMITDSSGHMTLFYWPTSYSAAYNFFNGVTIPTGPINLTGIVDEFSGSPEFIPMFEPGVTPDKFSMSNDATATNDADGFSEVTRGSTVTVTVTRSETADAATVDYSEQADSAVAGTDYTDNHGTLPFAIGQATASFTVNTAASPGDHGDKLFTILMANATGGAGILPTITGGPATIVITDPSTFSTEANNSFNENATIQPTGPRTGTAGLTGFNVESNANGANTGIRRDDL